MTENEALEKHKEDCKKCWDKACEHNIQCLQKKDIEVYERLMEFEAIGTVEELRALKENSFFNFESPVVRIDEKSYNKAIDDFAEMLNTDVETFKVEVNGVRADLLTLDYFSEFVFEVAEQMKGE